MTPAEPTLATTLAGIPLASPLVLASGILGTAAASLRRVAAAGAGAVTTKSCSLLPRPGHPSPCVLPWRGGLLNAVGLSNPGIDAELDEVAAYRSPSPDFPPPAPLILSIFADSPDAFARLAARAAAASPDLLELNVSCPNVASEFGTPFASDPAALADVVSAVASSLRSAAPPGTRPLPFSVKLSLQCPSIARMAVIARDNGASAITAINTVGPGMWIDTGTARPVLANTVGGLSGTAILPLAVRAVYDVSRAVSLPVIATGGVSTLDDVLQHLMAGATAVSIGTALYPEGPSIFTRLNRELLDWLRANGHPSPASLRALAHPR